MDIDVHLNARDKEMLDALVPVYARRCNVEEQIFTRVDVIVKLIEEAYAQTDEAKYEMPPVWQGTVCDIPSRVVKDKKRHRFLVQRETPTGWQTTFGHKSEAMAMQYRHPNGVLDGVEPR